MLHELDLSVTALHSHMSQPARLASLDTFRAHRATILVTTDVGSRGLDIPEVEMVVNWDLPAAPEDYVHRVGRTARAGRQGWAVSFVTERDVELVKGIEEKISQSTLANCASPHSCPFSLLLTHRTFPRRSRTTQTDVTMTELEMPEETVLEKLNAVSTAKRVANMVSPCSPLSPSSLAVQPTRPLPRLSFLVLFAHSLARSRVLKPQALHDEKFGERQERNRQKAQLAMQAATKGTKGDTKSKSRSKSSKGGSGSSSSKLNKTNKSGGGAVAAGEA